MREYYLFIMIAVFLLASRILAVPLLFLVGTLIRVFGIQVFSW